MEIFKVGDFPRGAVVKTCLPAQVSSLGREDPLEKEMATHSMEMGKLPGKLPGKSHEQWSQRAGYSL